MSQSVLITGTSSGIGLATARKMDRLGARVFAGYLPGEDLTALKEDASSSLTPLPIDITNSQSIQAALKTITNAVGTSGLYGLVNNAGITVTGPIESIPLEAIRQQFDVNFFGHIAVTQAFLPLVRQAKGRIVNLCSILGRVVAPFSAPYCASKFAMEAYTDALRMELKPWGIHVVGIEPGLIRTPIWEKTLTNVDEFLAELPPNARELYGERYGITMRESIAGASTHASEPEEVGEAIAHALTAPRPKTRYLVGKEARLIATLRWLLTDRLLDALILRRYKM